MDTMRTEGEMDSKDRLVDGRAAQSGNGRSESGDKDGKTEKKHRPGNSAGRNGTDLGLTRYGAGHRDKASAIDTADRKYSQATRSRKEKISFEKITRIYYNLKRLVIRYSTPRD